MTETMYQPWSYTVATGHIYHIEAHSNMTKTMTKYITLESNLQLCLFAGFDDSLKLLERLSMYVFDLPVNIAVRQFEDMAEAF